MPLKRTKGLRAQGKTGTAPVKKRIQALLRELVIHRDGGCILRKYPESGACGGYGPVSGLLILQAEHLRSRAYSSTYADPRNIVCLCSHHHGHWKERNSALYWDIIRRHLGEGGWGWLQFALRDTKAHRMTEWDWEKQAIALKVEIGKLLQSA